MVKSEGEGFENVKGREGTRDEAWQILHGERGKDVRTRNGNGASEGSVGKDGRQSLARGCERKIRTERRKEHMIN